MSKDREHPTLLEQLQISEEQLMQSINTTLTVAEIEELFRIYQKLHGSEIAAQIVRDRLNKHSGFSPLYHRQLLENARRNHQSTNNS